MVKHLIELKKKKTLVVLGYSKVGFKAAEMIGSQPDIHVVFDDSSTPRRLWRLFRRRRLMLVPFLRVLLAESRRRCQPPRQPAGY